MEGIHSKNASLVLIFILAALGIAVLKLVSQFSTSNAPEPKATYSYEMGRIKGYVGSFDLSDREVDRKILEEAVDAKSTKDSAKPNATKDKKTESKKKNEKKPTAKKTGDSSDRKPVLSTSIVGEGMQDKLSAFDQEQANAHLGRFAQANTNEQIPPQQNEATDPSGTLKSQQKDAGQWKSLISTSPTLQNVQALLQAHRKGEISDSDFYKIAFELFLDPNKAKEQAGYLLLSIDSSIQGFTFIARKYSQIPEAKRTQLWKIMLTYARPDHYQALNASLGSNEKSVVHYALQVLQVAVNQAKGVTGSTGGPTAVFVQPQSLQGFLSGLMLVAQRGDENSAMASSLYSEIQNLLKK